MARHAFRACMLLAIRRSDVAGSAKRFDAWAALSLGLAVFLMVLPIEADIIRLDAPET